MNNILKFQTDISISFNIIDKYRLSVAELNYINKELALSFFNMKEQNILQKKTIEFINEFHGKIAYFSRLNVHPLSRGKGLGSDLLKEVINFCNEEEVLLINWANAYGNLSNIDLIKFYQRSGMELIHGEGFLVYHRNMIFDTKYRLKI